MVTGVMTSGLACVYKSDTDRSWSRRWIHVHRKEGSGLVCGGEEPPNLLVPLHSIPHYEIRIIGCGLG